MKTTDSQIDYLSKRGKSYDYKYGILLNIIQAYLPKDKKVIELFGGVGITSHLIQSNLNPETHIINEIDDRCIEVLKEVKADTSLLDTAVIKKEDSFFSDIKEYDIVFADSNFTKKQFKKFDNIFRGIKDTLVLTETGVFNLAFNKTKTVNDYFEEYKKLFKKYNLGLFAIFYTHSFSIMVLKKSYNGECILSKNSNEYRDWRNYIKCINTH